MSGDERFALVFARCTGFVFRAPGFSHPSVPPPLRAGLAYAFSLALAPGIVGGRELPAGGFVVALVSEALLGAAIGAAASILYDAAYAGGRVIDDYIGIRVSMPTAGTVAPSGFGRLWSQAFTAGFFVLGAYREAIAAFAQAFQTLPPGALLSLSGIQAFACMLPVTMLRAAVLIAAPAVAIALAVQFALASVARVASRLSVFSLSFALVFSCVLLVTLAGLSYLLPLSARPWLDLSFLRAR